MIQPGFDSGYNEKGAPAGKKYGFLLGTIGAIESYVERTQGRTAEQVDELSSLKAQIKALKMHDMVERDWEALEHEQEHGADISNIKRETEDEKRQRESRLDTLQSKADDIVESIFSS